MYIHKKIPLDQVVQNERLNENTVLNMLFNNYFSDSLYICNNLANRFCNEIFTACKISRQLMTNA